MTDDTPETPVKPPYQPLPRMKRLAITFVLLFVIWAIFAYAVPFMMAGRQAAPPIKPEPVAAVPAAPAPDLLARFEDMEARIKALEDAANAPKPPVADPQVNDLAVQVTSHQQLLAEMKQTVDDSMRQVAAVTAFDQLKNAVLRGETFREPLRRLTTLMQGRGNVVPLLAKLTPYSETGLVTLDKLRTGFDAVIPKALAPKAGNWSEKMRSLIRVRKVGEEQKGTDDESVIARAEAALQQGNVAQALKELATLSPPAADAMAVWKTQANEYAQAQDALAALQIALLSKPDDVTP